MLDGKVLKFESTKVAVAKNVSIDTLEKVVAEKTEFRRIQCNSVTDTLMRAMEHAEEMDKVVVMYQTKKESDYPGGFFTQDELTLETLNYFLDRVKAWIFG